MSASKLISGEGRINHVDEITLDEERVFDTLIVGVAGNVNITMIDGSSEIIPLPAGMWPLAFKKIATASTTATGLFGGIEGKAS